MGTDPGGGAGTLREAASHIATTAT